MSAMAVVVQAVQGMQGVVAVGSAPPGTEQIATVIGWASFLAGVACIGAFIAAMGKGGIGALRHGQFEGGAGAVIALICGIFLTAAPAIFAVFGIASS